MYASRINLLGCVALTLCWLGYDHYRPWVNFHSEGLAMAGLSLLLLAHLAKASGPWDVPRMGLWIGVAAGLPWLQYLGGFGLFAGDALMVSLYLLGLLGAVAVGYGSLSPTATPARLHLALLHGLWVAALVSAAIGLAQWLMVQDRLAMYAVQTDVGDRAMGNLGQPNQLATLLLMGMMALTYVYQQKMVGRLGWAMAMAFMTLVLVMTGSRAGILSVLVLTVFLIWKSRREALGITRVDVLVWALGFVLGHLLLPYVAELLWGTGGGRSMESLTRANDRWVLWQQIVQGIRAAPWVGYGWDHTTAAQMAGALVVPGELPVSYAHNFVLDMLAWNGLPLGLLLTVAIAYWFVTRMARVRGAMGVYAMAGLLPFAVHSMVEYPFAYAYFLLSAGFLIGIVEACTPGVTVIKLNIWVSRSVLMVWMVVSSYLTVEYFSIEEDFRVVRFENLKIGHTPDDYERPHVWMLSQMAALLKALRFVPTPDMSAQSLEDLRLVARRFLTGSVNLRYAVALGLNGDPAGAALEMRVIRGLHGEAYYQTAKAKFREIEKKTYPQLSAVELP